MTSWHTAFIDLKTVFGTISRGKIVGEIRQCVDRLQTYLIQILYSKMSLWVQCDRKGHLSDSMPTLKAVKQGCILAPLLFIFSLNDLVNSLNNLSFHPPIRR